MLLIPLFWIGCIKEKDIDRDLQLQDINASSFLQKHHQKMWVNSTSEINRKVYLQLQTPSIDKNYFLSYQFDLNANNQNYCNTYTEGNYILVGIILYANIQILENSPTQFTYSRIEQGEDFDETISFSEDENGNLIEKHFEDGTLLNQRLFMPTNQTQEGLNIDCD